jgi:hypothetical protein
VLGAHLDYSTNTTHPAKMRRYKTVACILLTLSVFSFVLAAPVAVQEVRKACADAVDGGDNVIIGSGKRADEEGQAKLIQPGTSTEIQPASSSTAKSISWAPSKRVSGETTSEPLQPGIEPLPLPTEIQPESSSKAKSVSWAPSRVKLPSGEIISEPLPPETEPHPLTPGHEGFQLEMAAQQSPSPPKPKFNNIVSKLGKLGKLKFWRRISGTAGGVEAEG